jgi:hypothetical protein
MHDSSTLLFSRAALLGHCARRMPAPLREALAAADKSLGRKHSSHC